MREEHFSKEMVIAIPLPLVIQRNEKEIAPLQGRQECAAICLAGNSVAQWTTQPVEDRGLKQEGTDRFGLALQDLFNQVVHYVPVVSSERLDESVNVLLTLQGQRGQLQTGNPAFGAVFKTGDVCLRESEAHHLGEKCSGFGGCKTQICGAQFTHLASSTQSRQGEMGIF